jgi:hypothetical protein
MPTVTVPDFNSKDLWRTCRALFWSFLVAFVAAVYLGVLTPPEPIAAFMGVVTLIALWVVVYNIYVAMKGKPS